MTTTLRIDALGHSGDGVSEGPGGRVFVPFALPGELVDAILEGERARVVALLEPSPDRVEPPCPHFGTCGGCSLQHLAPVPYLDWKRGEVIAAFAQRGIEADIAPTIACRPATRRRAVFTAERNGRIVTLGFNRMSSHDVVAVPDCRVIVPEIGRSQDAIAALIAPLVQPGKRIRITVLALENGLDIAVDEAGRVDPAVLDALPTRISSDAIARLSVNGETVFRTRDPEMRSGDAVLAPTPGGFVQAVADAEDAMAATVLAGVRGAKTLADLFAGIGTFTARLARQGKVTAVESDPGAVKALQWMAKRAKGTKEITTIRRDLFHDPLSVMELRSFDAVVFDPPRAGAKAQAEMLARSKVGKVVAVSCNPATLARDARILIDGGYRLTGVQPIDQFLWSAHIEAVATFTR